MGFPGSSAGKEHTCNAGDLGSIPGLRRSPGGGHGKALQCSCLENSMDWRNPWGFKELDITEQLGTARVCVCVCVCVCVYVPLYF